MKSALLLSLTAATALLEPKPAPKEMRIPVVVELFTSEGCSSCPSADRVLLNLAQTQPLEGIEVIALGQHVDYWNRLGWTDPFSDKAYTERQRHYEAHFRTGSVYTPQAVVNGNQELVGSKQEGLEKAIRKAAAHPLKPIALTVQDRQVQIEVPTLAHPYEVYLAVVESGLSTQVGKGENAGKKLAHAPLVRRLTQLGSFTDGTTRQLRYELPQPLGTNQRIIVLAQEEDQGMMLAIGTKL